MENPFFWNEKTMRQIPNNFTIIKSITIILVYVLQLKKNRSFFLYSHTHELFLSKAATFCSLLLGYLLEGNNSLLSPPWLSPWRRQYLALSFFLHFSQAKIIFLFLGFTLYFPSPHRKDRWAKAKGHQILFNIVYL